MSNRTLGIVIAIIVLAVIGAAGAIRIMSNDSTGTAETAPAPANQTSDQDQAAGDTAGQEASGAASPQTLNGCTRVFDENKLKTATVATANQFVTLNVKGFGSIKVQLYDKDAPKTVENFLRLTNAGYFDCLTFHRVAKGFVVQSGDPTGTGSGGDSAFGGEFVDELNANTASYKEGYMKGVLAMANRGPNTNTSQFFIMLGDVELPHNYTIFGKVVDGLAVVDKIGQVEIVPQLGPTDGAPKEKVVIEKATISSK